LGLRVELAVHCEETLAYCNDMHVSSIDPRRAENRTSVEQLLEKMTKKERNRRRLFTAPKRGGVLK